MQIQYQAQRRVGELWGMASGQNLDDSWSALAPLMVAQASSAQAASAGLANPYMRAVSASYGDTTPNVEVAPAAFAGVMQDGRPLQASMYTAVLTTKELVSRGESLYTAFQAGAQALAVVVGAAVQDSGRMADMTAGMARTYTYYVRQAGGSCCSRCAVLVGVRSGPDAFLRHVCCQCTACPVEVTKAGVPVNPGGFYSSPGELFDSLSKAEQDARFTKAGAEAIRHGADVSRVVNARRGSYVSSYLERTNAGEKVARMSLRPVTIGKRPDGSPLQVFVTKAGRNNAKYLDGLRLMPEQLVKMAAGDAGRLRDLLTKYGYMY